MPVNPFRRVLHPSPSKRDKGAPAMETADTSFQSKGPGLTIAAQVAHHDHHGAPRPQQPPVAKMGTLNTPLLPSSDYRTSLIMPHLTRRFTLLRAPDGTMVTPEAMRAHLRAQRARARATGVPGTQCFLTEEEEDEIIDQLRVQTQADEVQLGNDSSNFQHDDVLELGGTDGFGGWGSQHNDGDSFSSQRGEASSTSRIHSLAESLGDLSAPETGDTIPSSGGGFFTSRTATRDVAYMSGAKRFRAKQTEPLAPTLEVADENEVLGEDRLELHDSEDDDESPPDEDGSGMPGDLFTAEKRASRRVDLSPIPIEVATADRSTQSSRDEEAKSGDATTSRHSQMLTNLTPEAFNRVSLALAEVYSMVHGRVDDGDSDDEDVRDETFESSTQDKDTSMSFARPKGRSQSLGIPHIKFAESYDELTEEEEELDSGDEDAEKRIRRSIDSDEHSFTSAHSSMMITGAEALRTGPHMLQGAQSVGRLSDIAGKEFHVTPNGLHEDEKRVPKPMPWHQTPVEAQGDLQDSSLPSGWTAQAEDGEPTDERDPLARSVPKELPGSMQTTDDVSVMLGGNQMEVDGFAVPRSSSPTGHRQPSSMAVANDGTPLGARQDQAPLLAPLNFGGSSRSMTPSGGLQPPDEPGRALSPLMAGLHFAGIGDRRSAIAAATAAGVAASAYVAQAQAHSKAQKRSMDELRSRSSQLEGADTNDSQAADGVDEDTQTLNVGSEIMSAGPSRLTPSGPASASPIGDAPGAMASAATSQLSTGDRLRPWGQLPSLQVPGPAGGEVLSAHAIAARSPHYFPHSNGRISQYADGFKPPAGSTFSHREGAPDEENVPASAREVSSENDSDAAPESPAKTVASTSSTPSALPASAAALHSATHEKSTTTYSPSASNGKMSTSDDAKEGVGKALFGDDYSKTDETPTGNVVQNVRDSNAAPYFEEDDDVDDVWTRVARNTASIQQQSGSMTEPSSNVVSSDTILKSVPVNIDHLREIQANLVRSASSKRIGVEPIHSGATMPAAIALPATSAQPSASPTDANTASNFESISNGQSADVVSNGRAGVSHAPSQGTVVSKSSLQTSSTSIPPSALPSLREGGGKVQILSSLDRDASQKFSRSHVMYDVTSSHRPTSPVTNPRDTSLTKLPSLQDLPQFNNSTELEGNSSLVAMIEQTNRAHDALPSEIEKGDRAATSRAEFGLNAMQTDVISEEHEVIEDEIAQEDGFGGFVIETRSIPRSKSYDGVSASSSGTTQRKESVDDLTTTPQPQASVPAEQKASGDVSRGAVWSSLPEHDEYAESHERDLTKDVAAQARAATEALKGAYPQRPSLNGSSLGKKARRKLARHISQPELLMTTQRLQYADDIQQPDSSLRKKATLTSNSETAPAPQTAPLPVHPLDARARTQRKPSPRMEGVEGLRSPGLNASKSSLTGSTATDYRFDPQGPSQQMQREASYGQSGHGLIGNRAMSPREGALSPRLPSSTPAHHERGEEANAPRGLARFMSRLRTRSKTEERRPSEEYLESANEARSNDHIPAPLSPTLSEHVPTQSYDRDAEKAERKARRIHTKSSAPHLNERIRTRKKSASQGQKDGTSAPQMPPPRSSSQRSRPAQASGATSTLSDVQKTVMPEEVLSTKATTANPPPHARIRPSSPKLPAVSQKIAERSQAPESGVAKVTFLGEASAKSARDTIIRRTIIVSTYDLGNAEDRRKSGMSHKVNGRKAVDINSRSELEPNALPNSSAGQNASSATHVSDEAAQSPGDQAMIVHGKVKIPPSVSLRTVDASANTTLAVPEPDVSMRTSNASGYGPSIYDLYADRDGSSFDGSSFAHSYAQQHTPQVPSVVSHRRSVLDPANSAHTGARHIEVTERADGSVVWQVIAGLADRASTYSTFALDERNSTHDSKASETLDAQQRNSRSGASSNDQLMVRPNELVTSEEGRSLFARSRGKAHDTEATNGESVPPLPSGASPVDKTEASTDEKKDDDVTAEVPLGHIPTSSATTDASEAQKTVDQPATRIVYTSDAELAAILEQLAGPDKSSAKFAFQRVGGDEPTTDNGLGAGVYAPGHDRGNVTGTTLADGYHTNNDPFARLGGDPLTLGVDTRRGAGAGGMGGWKANRPDSEYQGPPQTLPDSTMPTSGRPVSIFTDVDLAADASGVLRQQRAKIESEIYSLLQRGSGLQSGNGL